MHERWYRRGVSATAPVVTLDVNGLFDHVIGDRGLAEADLEGITQPTAAATARLGERRSGGELPFLDLPYDEAAISAARAEADRLAGTFSRLLVFGIGGSALGTRAALNAIAPAARGRGLEVVVVDNIDPVSVASALGSEGELEDTCINVISKSGETVETMAQFFVLRERLERAFGEKGYRERTVVTTAPNTGTLRAIVERDGLRSLPVPPGVGGRFSVLSAVGLMPMAAAGLDVETLCAGAREMDSATRAPEWRHNAAALHAACLYLACKQRGATIHVLMPYADGLRGLADWYVQLSAESLGKRESGQTPVAARGATDQHSQLQLFIDGPRDKVVTFIRVENHGDDLEIPDSSTEGEALACLAGMGLGELLNVEQRATELALAGEGRAVTVLGIERLDEFSLGALFQFFEFQTLVLAELFGVDALDQPGVEAGKRLAYAMAGHSGHADLKRAIDQRLGAKKAGLVVA